ncbi:hypothetical protein [Paenibacillus sp. BK033]|uniref:hypothetical protein n=1 Tax=Paenibacillus sp. BK033 TaxID=2512133 RepID=UPI001FB7DEB5|nr:hypothetical protein [Paenibacillus sp. BK033]
MARSFDSDVWVNDCFRRISGAERLQRANEEFYGEPTQPFRAILTDLRQPNEYERCRAEGFVIIRVTAPDGVRIQRAIDAKDTFNYADLVHSTESHVSSFVVDYEIENRGSLAELYTKVDEVLADLNAKKIT